MTEQAGLPSPHELQGALEEYRRFCEALPRDAEVPSFMEYRGRANPASDVLGQLRQAAAGQDFGSIQELQAFCTQHLEQANDQPCPDFEGLSPSQMQEILDIHEETGGKKKVPLLYRNSALTPDRAESSPLIQVIRWLLRYHAEHGGKTRLTDRQNYPRDLCRVYLARFPQSRLAGGSAPKEASLPGLVVAHDVVVAQGWTREESRRSELTTEGVQMLADDASPTIFMKALDFFLFYSSWVENLDVSREDEAHLSIIQRSAIFSLYLLSRYPEGTLEDLTDRFVRAFPAFLGAARGDVSEIRWLRQVYQYLLLQRFCVPLGLVKITTDGEYRTTPLFRQGLVFSTERPDTRPRGSISGPPR
ncbi:hypothetical protein [Alkalispirochaeta alkalica]|uniref:hypothetical protein n=1 Tax=Alkalispirochaeta alkalica TaxID=46356 RepID=UPI00035E7CB3|nr:hypothetical protein [Alkalispirochaeta alkalica]